MTHQLPKLATGVPGLDKLTMGGLPIGRTTLIAGKSGTCKSVLSLQIAANLARAGAKTIVIAVEEAPEDLVTTGDSLGFDMTGLAAKGLLHFSDLTRPMEGPTVVSGDYDSGGFVHRIQHLVKETGATAIVLDSSTALFSPRPPEEAMRAAFFQIIHAMRELGLTSIVTAEAPSEYGQLTALGVEDFVADLVLILRNHVDGDRRRRSIEVHKYRRSPHYKGEYPFNMTLEGLTVFPLDVSEPVAGPPERYPSGIEGLDEMNCGGWLRDSIILLRGPSGSGKTTLAGTYARAGALRDERVVYYGFEETKPVLMRNFKQVGLDMDALEKNGNLRVRCRYPEATSPEDLLVDIREGLDNFKPSLIVMDSISSIEHSTSERGFRQFIIGLASLLRERSRSALLTQTTTLDATDDTAFLSTLPDAILVLDYDLQDEAMERSMRVLKMRGSAHVTGARRFDLTEHGIVVRKRQG